ncbi:hypothetical protein GCM10009654_49420 [Streptomyces hebeiensis]|uniref:LysR substrate-binding domain-containing protein n=1 Tax=Streptomyces hebeiensis TaxID=229486 RepID=A0ABP4FNX1_9ACTN
MSDPTALTAVSTATPAPPVAPEVAPATAPGRPVRLGYHGSAEVAARVVRLAGRDETAVRIEPYDIADPFAELRRGAQDVVIVKFALREPDLVTSGVLTHDARAVVVGAAHPLAGRASVSVEELADHGLFDRPGKLPGYVWDEVVPPRTPAGRPLRREHRVSDVPTMMRLVARGTAVHLSLVSIADVAPPGIRVVPVHDLPAAPVALAWCKEREPAAHVADFIAAAEAGAAR